ncbi:MAG TPA: FimV/HubP family polar landmark protein, partial [Casimicrobiaceae bacterium]|nr:FimV/HubP family polar landmark protein [Casimicrobiaceae bacterium]
AESASAPSSAQPPAPAASTAAPGAAPSSGAPATTPPSATAPAAPAESKAAAPAADTAAKATPKTAPPAKTEPQGFFADLLSGTPNWALGAGALAILGLIAAFVAARRRKGTKFEDSIISGTDIKTNTVFGSTGGGVVNTGENSLASDFSREGLGNIDTDEVDPIAEAEVYLAYGRDAQAEEILKDALKKDPQRQEIYLKLLEIHSQHNKPSAFETVASELFAVSHGQGDIWHKAVTLGRQLDPANPMFQDEGQASAAAGAQPAASVLPRAAPSQPFASTSGTTPSGATTSGGGQTHAALTEPGSGTAGSDALDWAPPSFSPALAGAGAKSATERADSPATDSAAHDFASNDGDISISPAMAPEPKSAADILAGAASALARSASTPVAAVEAAAGKAALGATKGSLDERVEPAGEPTRFDLDFHLDDPVQPASAAPAGHARGEPALHLEGAHLAPASSPAAETNAPLDLDKLDLSFEPGRVVAAEATPSVMDGQWHDAATKLDLAKAYQEMGDREGARDILQEVLHEGDEQQKSEAQALLAKLA